MRAAVMRDHRLVVDDIAEPVPGPEEVLVETIACGICGSDLHCLQHADEFIATSEEAGMEPFVFDTGRDLVMGHEISARVLRPSPDNPEGLREGDAVAVMPGVLGARGLIAPIGYSNDYPGGYAERFVAASAGCLPVPDHLDPVKAALTEPLAVGLHAVNQGRLRDDEGAIVVGCGPVGLTVVAWLAARGVAPVVAADFSPTRRQLAATMGADVVVDPGEESAVDAWRAASSTGRAPVVFECVGVPGMIEGIITEAPRRTRIVIVGVCMQSDTFRPTMAISKHLSLHFVLGWNPTEFASSLEAIADGTIDVDPLVTGRVDIDGVPGAFEELASPMEHGKILVVPGS